jgi:hypothetical protein
MEEGSKNISGTLSIQNTNINLSNKQIRKNKKKERRAERRSSIKVIPKFLLPSFISSCMSKTNESSISISSPVVVSPSTTLYPILPLLSPLRAIFRS